jgi:hypothetical protein
VNAARPRASCARARAQVPLKGGVYRHVSMALLAHAVATPPPELSSKFFTSRSRNVLAKTNVADLMNTKTRASLAETTEVTVSGLSGFSVSRACSRRRWQSVSGHGAMEEFGVPHQQLPISLAAAANAMVRCTKDGLREATTPVSAARGRWRYISERRTSAAERSLTRNISPKARRCSIEVPEPSLPSIMSPFAGRRSRFSVRKARDVSSACSSVALSPSLSFDLEGG